MKIKKFFCLDSLIDGQTNELREIGKFNIPSVVTGASYSSKNKKLAVLTYDGIGIYDVDGESSLLNPASHFIYAVLGQCEAICFDEDDLIFTNEPGRIWKQSLKSILNDTFLLSSIPRLKLRKSKDDPILDGNAEDWKNSVSFKIQQGKKNSDHVIHEEKDQEKRNVNIILTDKGLYISFEFTRQSPKTGSSKDDWLCDRFIISLSTKLDILLPSPQNQVYTLYFPQKMQGKKAHIIDANGKIVGIAKGNT